MLSYSLPNGVDNDPDTDKDSSGHIRAIGPAARTRQRQEQADVNSDCQGLAASAWFKISGQ
ncbi:hypothetical protein JCM14469_42850 [Desulfatiferula olefinivorans]